MNLYQNGHSCKWNLYYDCFDPFSIFASTGVHRPADPDRFNPNYFHRKTCYPWPVYSQFTNLLTLAGLLSGFKSGRSSVTNLLIYLEILDMFFTPQNRSLAAPAGGTRSPPAKSKMDISGPENSRREVFLNRNLSAPVNFC